MVANWIGNDKSAWQLQSASSSSCRITPSRGSGVLPVSGGLSATRKPTDDSHPTTMVTRSTGAERRAHPAGSAGSDFSGVSEFQKFHGLGHLCWRRLKEKDTIDAAAVPL